MYSFHVVGAPLSVVLLDSLQLITHGNIDMTGKSRGKNQHTHSPPLPLFLMGQADTQNTNFLALKPIGIPPLEAVCPLPPESAGLKGESLVLDFHVRKHLPI